MSRLEIMQRNFRVALELHTTGVAVMRQNLRRRFPDETDEQISARLREWLRARPGPASRDGAAKRQ